MTIYNKIREKFRFTVGKMMHWKNIIVDSVDSSLDRNNTCRKLDYQCCVPDDDTEELISLSNADCTMETIPTEICHYTKGDTVFRIADHEE